uniref:PH domain-containing protein n=1 Tax=Pelusios castaneus TaxID=367368 RepID=A0A8C8SWI3_9SAUR
MSRRRISCKDLGAADYQGWLYKKKEKGAFIGNKWKKFWFVLKDSSLYWYSSQLAEKAEGFINLPNFTVGRAIECKKKHAIKVSQPQIKTFYFAAENVEEMNSESEHEDPEIAAETPPPPYTAQQQPFSTSSLSSEASCSLSSMESTMKSQSSSSSLLAKMTFPERQSWLDIVNISSATEEVDQPLSFCVQIHAGDLSMADCSELTERRLLKSNNGSLNPLLNEDISSSDSLRDRLAVSEDVIGTGILSKEQAKYSEDEMEKLYKSLEQASLSPIGDRRPSTRKELRKSFIKRSKNPSMNEKLHKIRMLNSTLKCKEHDLATINQLLEDPELTAGKYREWKNTNTMLVHDIYQQQAAMAVKNGSQKLKKMPLLGTQMRQTLY